MASVAMWLAVIGFVLVLQERTRSVGALCAAVALVIVALWIGAVLL